MYEIYYRLKDFLVFKPSIIIILRYLLHCLPDWVFWCTPISLLLSLITHNGKLVKSNEIVAIKSIGINLNYIILQALLVGFLCFIIKSALVHEVLPKYKNLSIEIYEHEIKKRPREITNILNNVILELPGKYIIIAQNFDIKNNEFKDVVLERYQDSNLIKQILAESLKLENGTWFLYDFVERTFDKNVSHQTRKIKEKFNYSIDTSIIYRNKREIFELTTTELKSRMKHLNKKSSLYNRLSANYYLRAFYPLLCPFLSLVGVAIPLHSNIGYTHTRGLGTGIAVVILLYFIISTAYHLTDNRIICPVIMFSVLFIIFFAVGIYFVMKIKR